MDRKKRFQCEKKGKITDAHFSSIRYRAHETILYFCHCITQFIQVCTYTDTFIFMKIENVTKIVLLRSVQMETSML